MRPVSRGTRNPFWSDIYEIAMCFALSAVALKALISPRKERAFEVTPKGQRIRKNTSAELSSAWPHLITFGLLVGGLVLAFQNLRHGTGDPGLPVSIFWGSVNLFLLTIAMFVASEQPQGRQAFRLNRDFASELFVGDTAHTARIMNINEHGAALLLEHPVFSTQDAVTLLLTSSQGTLVRLDGRIIRQEQSSDGGVEAGLQFGELDDATREALVDKIFGDPAPWEESSHFKPGVASSLRSLFYALTAPWRAFNWERRRMLRLPHATSCRLSTSTALLPGRLEDMSFTGVSVLFASVPKGSFVGGLLELPRVTLKVTPVSVMHRFRNTCVRFRVDRIERGQQHWRELHKKQWSRS